MKKHYLLALALLPLCASAQLKQIAFAELTSGSGMFFGAEMTTTTITVTLQGPSDRFIAFGFGTGMSNGNDAVIWSTLGTGVAPLTFRDHKMIGQGSEPSVDGQQDWTVISNNVSGGNRTIVASRALSTGDANDVTFNFASTTQNLFWAKSGSASNQIAYHGSGNRASGIVRNWVLVDQTAPLLSSTTPADNASGVSLTNNLTISFNEPISWSTGSITLYDENNAVVQTISSGSSGVNISGSNMSWNPTANLIPNTDYYVHIDPTAIKDVAGNAFAGFTDNTTWNFNTNDVTAPALAASPFSPADNAAGVALTSDMTVTFNENIQFGTGNIQLFDGSNNLIQAFDVTAPVGISVSNAVLTINPTANLVMNTNYYILIANGAIQDLSGNNYAGIAGVTTWNFNTNDLVAPAIVGLLSPADNATGVLTSTGLSLSFSEDVMLTSTGSLSLFKAGGTLVSAFTMASSGITVTNDQVTVVLATLDEQQGYYVTIDPGFITDLQGNAFAGFTNQTTWNFTTGDFTAPAISGAFSPADNSINIPITIDLVATFNEPVALGTGFIHLVNETSGVVQTFDVATNPDVIASGNTVTVQDVFLSTMTIDMFHVTIDPTAVTDINGNGFAGISDTTVWNFRAEGETGLDELSQAGIKWDGKTLSIVAKTAGTINLLDASGKLVRENLGQSTDCSALTPGIYLVTIRSASNYQTVRIYVR